MFSLTDATKHIKPTVFAKFLNSFKFFICLELTPNYSKAILYLLFSLLTIIVLCKSATRTSGDIFVSLPPDWLDDAPKAKTEVVVVEAVVVAVDDDVDEVGKKEKADGVEVVTELPKTKGLEVVTAVVIAVHVTVLFSSVLIVIGLELDVVEVTSVILGFVTVPKVEPLPEKLKLAVVVVVERVTEADDKLFLDVSIFSPPNLKRLTGDLNADNDGDSLVNLKTDGLFSFVSFDSIGLVVKPKHAVTDGFGTLDELEVITASGSFSLELSSKCNGLEINDLLFSGSGADSFVFITASSTLFLVIQLFFDSEIDSVALISKGKMLLVWETSELFETLLFCVLPEANMTSGILKPVVAEDCVADGSDSDALLTLADTAGLVNMFAFEVPNLKPEVVVFVCDSLTLTPNLKVDVVVVDVAVHT